MNVIKKSEVEKREKKALQEKWRISANLAKEHLYDFTIT